MRTDVEPHDGAATLEGGSHINFDKAASTFCCRLTGAPSTWRQIVRERIETPQEDPHILWLLLRSSRRSTARAPRASCTRRAL